MSDRRRPRGPETVPDLQRLPDKFGRGAFPMCLWEMNMPCPASLLAFPMTRRLRTRPRSVCLLLEGLLSVAWPTGLRILLHACGARGKTSLLRASAWRLHAMGFASRGIDWRGIPRAPIPSKRTPSNPFNVVYCSWKWSRPSQSIHIFPLELGWQKHLDKPTWPRLHLRTARSNGLKQ
jgi:hypothetical protein